MTILARRPGPPSFLGFRASPTQLEAHPKARVGGFGPLTRLAVWPDLPDPVGLEFVYKRAGRPVSLPGPAHGSLISDNFKNI